MHVSHNRLIDASSLLLIILLFFSSLTNMSVFIQLEGALSVFHTLLVHDGLSASNSVVQLVSWAVVATLPLATLLSLLKYYMVYYRLVLSGLKWLISFYQMIRIAMSLLAFACVRAVEALHGSLLPCFFSANAPEQLKLLLGLTQALDNAQSYTEWKGLAYALDMAQHKDL